MERGTRPWAGALSGLLILTTLLYLPSLFHGYQYEDANWVSRAPPSLDIPSRWLAMVSHPPYQPVPDHAINLGLHLLNGTIVFALVRTLGGTAWGLLAAGIFLLHPFSSAAVLSLSARTDLLMTTGTLLATWALCWRTPAKWLVYGLAIVGAALSKELGVVAVLLSAMTILVWYRIGTVRSSALESSSPVGALRAPRAGYVRPWVALSLAQILGGAGLGIGWRWLFLTPHAGGSALPPLEYVAYQLGMLWHLLRLVLWPVGFSLDHDALALSPGWLVLSGVLTLAAVSTAVLTWRVTPTLAWAIAWVGLSVAPRLLFQTSEFVTESQLYLPMVGISVGLGAAMLALGRPQERMRICPPHGCTTR